MPLHLSDTADHRFWMVQGNEPAIVRHATRGLAEAEANRLARKHPGQDFWVMEAVTVFRRIDVERIELTPPRDGDLDLPF